MGLKCDRTYQVVRADEINILDDDINTMKKTDANKEVGLEKDKTIIQ